jgi:hypothetical protein
MKNRRTGHFSQGLCNIIIPLTIPTRSATVGDSTRLTLFPSAIADPDDDDGGDAAEDPALLILAIVAASLAQGDFPAGHG